MLGIPSIGIGAASLWNNVKKGHIGSAIWDGVGIIADGVAVAVPGVPGGVGLATKAARLAALKNKVENTIDTAETVVEVGTAVATGDTNALVEVITDKALDRAMGGKKKGGEAPGPKSPKQTNAEADAAGSSAGRYANHTDGQFLGEIAARAEAKVGGTGAVAGTHKHTYAEKLLNRYQSMTGQRHNLVSEKNTSHLNGVPVSRGTAGSARPDVYDPASGAVYDYKFTVNPGRGIPAAQQRKNILNLPKVTSQTEINP